MPHSGHTPLALFATARGEYHCCRDQEKGHLNFQPAAVVYLESEWTMRRRPNRRESIENAPGPKRKRAVMTQIEKTSRKGSGACGHSNMRTCTSAETQHTTGVKAPRQNAPASMITPAISQVAIGTDVLVTLFRTSIPAAHRRKSTSPQPAAPAGNIENSLCTALR